ncbi:UNVERIFIED_CONTAM: hypothetical protein Sradi_1884900 [Sesamum radiatum]|uniref:Wall-associated receptor kinase galacturonan-binding domain-containing protein n=1 Tax=Sesamum radiatum TaxID=300843 RepID=A0AAW2TX28_SESRA
MFFTCFIMAYFLHTSYGELNHQCPPSSCGSIRNISNPFRLKNDPKHCGNPIYELECENNTTSVYLNSHRYLVKAINYSNYTIRLVDAGITNDSCSFPQYSLGSYHFQRGYPYEPRTPRNATDPFAGSNQITWSITFMSCPYPVNNSLFLEVDHCAKRNYSFMGSTSDRRRTYIKFGRLNGSYVMDMCKIEGIVMSSLPVKDEKSLSLSEIHSSLLYGFELSWFNALCGGKCRCYLDRTGAKCYPSDLCIYFPFTGHPIHCGKKEKFTSMKSISAVADTVLLM